MTVQVGDIDTNTQYLRRIAESVKQETEGDDDGN